MKTIEIKTQEKQGMKFFTALGLAFIILKLCGVIAWSWWLVLLPLYFWVGVYVLFMLSVVLSACGYATLMTTLDAFKGAHGKKKNK